jgi:hypothetical protein
MRAATNSRTRTRGRFKPTLGTRTFNTRFATRNSRRTASRISGGRGFARHRAGPADPPTIYRPKSTRGRLPPIRLHDRASSRPRSRPTGQSLPSYLPEEVGFTAAPANRFLSTIPHHSLAPCAGRSGPRDERPADAGSPRARYRSRRGRFDARRDARLHRSRKPLPLRRVAGTVKLRATRYCCAPRRPPQARLGAGAPFTLFPHCWERLSTFARSSSAREHPPSPASRVNPWTHPHRVRGF